MRRFHQHHPHRYLQYPRGFWLNGLVAGRLPLRVKVFLPHLRLWQARRARILFQKEVQRFRHPLKRVTASSTEIGKLGGVVELFI